MSPLFPLACRMTVCRLAKTPQQQVWEGTFNFCSDPVTAEAHDESVFYVYTTDENGIRDQSECEAQGFEWKNAAWNFDNFGNALQSVLIIFTYNGWQEIMFNAINARCRGDCSRQRLTLLTSLSSSWVLETRSSSFTPSPRFY